MRAENAKNKIFYCMYTTLHYSTVQCIPVVVDPPSFCIFNILFFAADFPRVSARVRICVAGFKNLIKN